MLRFRVPASTSNLGHGFDCLGVALGIANVISVTPSTDGTVAAPGATGHGLAAMAGQVRDACQRAWNRALPGLAVTVAGEVPIARGMGSSATILLGVAAACQALAGRPFERGELLRLGAGLEGHPDNVAAACLGGFTVVGPGDPTGTTLRWQRFAVPEGLVAVIAIPPFEVKTSEARRILPATLSRAEAVLALQRTALITAALAAGQPEDLRGLFDDAWHERYRADLNPGLDEARAAAHGAGAIGTILSGSGSSVLSFATRSGAEAVRGAVAESYRRRQTAVETRIIGFDNDGLQPVG